MQPCMSWPVHRASLQLHKAWEAKRCGRAAFATLARRKVHSLFVVNSVSVPPTTLYCAGCMFGFVYKGLYARQLQFWFTLFPPESFHIVSFTDLVQNPKQVMDEVVRFLGLPPHNSWVNPAFAKHAYLSLAERSRMCRDSELRHAWTYLSAYFKRPQLELQALLERYGWAGKLQGLFWPEQDCSKVAAQALGNSMGAA